MVARRRSAAIHGKPFKDDGLAERPEHFGGSVFGGVIYNDDFFAGKLLAQRRFHGVPYEFLVVVTRNYDAEKWL